MTQVRRAHQDLIDQLTTEEKASLMSGANFWNTKSIDRVGIPSLMLTDGPHGLRKQAGSADHLGLFNSVPATCFPTAAGLANTWDLDLLYRVGRALGAEARAEGVSVLLGPGLNIKRNPLSGRNFEYFSEDPLLSGELAAALIKGIQSEGVAACPKHFAVNSQEKHRMSIDEVVDTRALHETYLEGFRIAVTKGEPQTIMSSYNRVNGIYANEHTELLTDILRTKWGFNGLVVTDWGGNNDRVEALKAGNALEMPSTGGITDRQIVEAINDGTLDIDTLDDRVEELLTLVDQTGRANRDLPQHDSSPADLNAHHDLAVEAAAEAIVLLKNEPDYSGTTLPLEPGQKVAVLGAFAHDLRVQGAGSSKVNPTRVASPAQALRDAGVDVLGVEPGFKRHGGASDRLRRKAVDLACRADQVLVFVGLDESLEAEAADRPHMRIPKNQLLLIGDLVRIGVEPIVVLVGGSPMELPFADHVPAIVAGYLAGQGGAEALAAILTGAANPSGRLAETFPLKYEDVPSALTYGKTEAASFHHESIYIGYRYYDKIAQPVRYPFGHGLSYTSFAYSKLSVSDTGVDLSVTNTGSVDGCEVVQVYAAPHASDGFIAPQELAGFARVCLKAGETKEVSIEFAEHAFSVYDTDEDRWRTQAGPYEIRIGASSRDIRLKADWDVPGDKSALEYDQQALAPYFTGEIQDVSEAQFAALMGRPLPDHDWDRQAPLTDADILAQLKGRGGLAGGLGAVITGVQKALHAAGKPMSANNVNFVLDMPFRLLPRFSQGQFSEESLQALLRTLNGDLAGGAKDLISSLSQGDDKSGSEWEEEHDVDA